MLPFMGLAAASTPTDGVGPSGDPSGGVTSHWGGDKVALSWVNGDVTASTQAYVFSPGCPGTKPDDMTLIRTYSPGVSSADTNRTEHCSYWLRHVKNGQYSQWHQVITGIESCAVCPA